MLTLKAVRVKEKTGHWKGFFRTEFYKESTGELFAVFPAEQQQPHKNKKTIVINCFRWKIEWSK